MWKHLTHPNILPLLGVTIDRFQLISNWMSGGHLLGYIKNNSDADRLGLASILPVLFALHLLPLPVIWRRQWALLPPLLQYNSWRPQGCM